MSIANPAITATLLWLLTALLCLLRRTLLAAALLGESGNGQQQYQCKESDECFHANLVSSLEHQRAPVSATSVFIPRLVLNHEQFPADLIQRLGGSG
jgi:hypothetical protein